MISTGGAVANAQGDARNLVDVHGLRRTALLLHLVEADGRVRAAETLGVSYGALARAADTGPLTGRMRDALTRHLFEGGKVDEDQERHRMADLERCVAELEEGAREKPGDEVSQVVELNEASAKIGEELERLGRRIAALESRGPTPQPASVRAADHPTPSRPAYDLVVSLHPEPGDDEKRFGAAAPLVVDWRRLREEYGAAPDGLVKLRAEDGLLEMELLLIAGCGVTLPPADYPWDRFDLEDQTRRRKRRQDVVREEIRRAELRRWMRRVLTLGLWLG